MSPAVQPAPYNPPPPPPYFTIDGVTGDSGDWVASLTYKGQSYQVRIGSKVPDEAHPDFIIMKIDANGIEAFAPGIQRIIKRHFLP